MTPHSEDAPDTLPLPATGDVVAAWPREPQQLFLLLHGADQCPADWLPLAQAIAHHFPQGLVAALATPAVLLCGSDDVPTRMPAAVEALRERVRRWQAHTGLRFDRTALITQGMATSTALRAIMHHADLCARLFAVGGQLDGHASPISDQTSLHWLHGEDDAGIPPMRARETAQHLQALDIDLTLDILPGSCTVSSPALQQRVLALLQGHVPRRLWREALASAGALDVGRHPPRTRKTDRH
jgi:phospholipase/carboxylesterase